MIERTIRRLLLAALFAGSAFAQSNPYTSLQPIRLGDYFLNLPTTRVLPPKTWEVRFTHRFSQPINEGDAHSLWGLDSAADVAFGVTYAPRQDLEVGIFRTNLLDDIETSAKVSIFQQSDGKPLSIAARAGFDWRTQEDIEHKVSPFVQAIISRQLGPRVEVFAVPSYIADDPLFDSAFNVPVGVAFMMKPGFSVAVELTPENSDAPDDVETGIGWSIGLKRAIGGHYFEVLLSDTRATHVDQYVSNVPLGGIDTGDIHLGFNIARRFGGQR